MGAVAGKPENTMSTALHGDDIVSNTIGFHDTHSCLLVGAAASPVIPDTHGNSLTDLHRSTVLDW
jgi:hypothetical protein